MKARIGSDPNECTLSYDDPLTGDRVTREFWAPHGGGYIRDVTHQPGTLGEQVCARLARRGSTLRWHPEQGLTLADTIRREYRRMRRAAEVAP